MQLTELIIGLFTGFLFTTLFFVKVVVPDLLEQLRKYKHQIEKLSAQ